MSANVAHHSYNMYNHYNTKFGQKPDNKLIRYIHLSNAISDMEIDTALVTE